MSFNFTTSNMFVIVSPATYGSEVASLWNDQLYPNREQAENALKDLRKGMASVSGGEAIGNRLYVSTLDDFIDEVKSDSWEAGRQAERYDDPR